MLYDIPLVANVAVSTLLWYAHAMGFVSLSGQPCVGWTCQSHEYPDETVVFNSMGIFLSHITLDYSAHFTHPIHVLWLTSAAEPISLVYSDPMYFNDVGSSSSTICTVVYVPLVGLGKYCVFVLLIFSPCLSNTTIHVSSPLEYTLLYY